MRSRIDQHFAGRIAPGAERSMREHLPDCDSCRSYYDRHLLLDALDPTAPKAQERLGGALGLHRFGPPRAFATALGVATAAAALALVVWTGQEDSSFVARGGAPVAPARLLVYRAVPEAPAEPLGEAITSTDELAFAYESQGEARYLMVFGVDEHRHVFWYYPSWTDPSENPSAVFVAATQGVRELPEAVTHRLDGARLTLHAVFLDQPRSVREIEELVTRQPNGAVELPIPGAIQQRRSLEVLHREGP